MLIQTCKYLFSKFCDNVIQMSDIYILMYIKIFLLVQITILIMKWKFLKSCKCIVKWLDFQNYFYFYVLLKQITSFPICLSCSYFFFINIYVHNKENIEIIIEEHGSSLPLKANPIIRPYFQCTEIIKYC